MAMLKWTIESILAAVAVAATTAGGLYTTSYHWGVVNQQIVAMQEHNAQMESHVAKHDEQLSDIKQQNATMKQSVDDIKDTVHDISFEIKRHPRDNNK